MNHGGVFLPMYQSEALWINFAGSYPMAIKVAAGKIDAITGEEWKNEISRRPQDYLVVPEQPWLDGFNVDEGLIRQFVAMPLGSGYSVEEQITGKAEHGGLQILVYPLKAELYEPPRLVEMESLMDASLDPCASGSGSFDMGLAPGGKMEQEIY